MITWILGPLVSVGLIAIGIPTLRRVWRCGLVGFWMPERARIRHLCGDQLRRDAEKQHGLILSGDDAGIYGNYPPTNLSEN